MPIFVRPHMRKGRNVKGYSRLSANQTKMDFHRALSTLNKVRKVRFTNKLKGNLERYHSLRGREALVSNIVRGLRTQVRRNNRGR